MKQIFNTIFTIVFILAITNAPADAGNRWKGKWYFSKKCSFCHSVSIRQNSEETGPHLRNVLGRTVAFRNDTKYSPHLLLLKEYGIRWTPDLLRKFIMNRDGSWFNHYREKWLKDKCNIRQSAVQPLACTPYTYHRNGRPINRKDLEDVISYLAAFQWWSIHHQ